jgi:hypothetical protein
VAYDPEAGSHGTFCGLDMTYHDMRRRLESEFAPPAAMQVTRSPKTGLSHVRLRIG